MAESTRLVDLVQTELDRFLDDRADHLAEIASELQPFTTFARDLLRGGKRFRALFCYWGWQSVTGLDADFDPLHDSAGHPDLPSVALSATALEMFHAAALVHDDIMDNSDTRRGLPAAHRRFEALHRDGHWLGPHLAFGQSGALLLGDLLLGWSDELLDAGLATLASRDAATAARAEFSRMRTEVTVGQYLDILEEKAWRSRPDTEHLERAERVIIYKSAKYSIESPLTIGGALAGGSADQLAALRAFGLPLGIAYQLRDDLLGVFGDAAVTGKPSGDDLREGKRTVLIALARQHLPAGMRNTLDELLGDPDLDAEQISMLQAAIRESGAVDRVERIIDQNVQKATAVLADAPLSQAARRMLGELAETVIRRDA
ncbi:MAG: polyprenyl synthetase family protein [Microbacteriaceae bacterium]